MPLNIVVNTIKGMELIKYDEKTLAAELAYDETMLSEEGVVRKLEERKVETPVGKLDIAPPDQMTLFKHEDHPIMKELKGLEVDTMTPLEALETLALWKKKIQ